MFKNLWMEFLRDLGQGVEGWDSGRNRASLLEWVDDRDSESVEIFCISRGERETELQGCGCNKGVYDWKRASRGQLSPAFGDFGCDRDGAVGVIRVQFLEPIFQGDAFLWRFFSQKFDAFTDFTERKHADVMGLGAFLRGPVQDIGVATGSFAQLAQDIRIEEEGHQKSSGRDSICRQRSRFNSTVGEAAFPGFLRKSINETF